MESKSSQSWGLSCIYEWFEHLNGLQVSTSAVPWSLIQVFEHFGNKEAKSSDICCMQMSTPLQTYETRHMKKKTTPMEFLWTNHYFQILMAISLL